MIASSPRKSLSPFLRSALLSLALAVSLLPLAGCSMFSSQHPTAETAVLPYDTAEPAGLKQRWQRQIGIVPSANEKVRNAWRIGDSIYIVTSRNQLHSINAAAGTTNWQADLGDNALQIYRPQEAPNNRLFVLTRSAAVMLDRRTGEVVKTGQLDFAAASNPVVSENAIMVGGGFDRFYCLYIDIFAKRKWQVYSRADSFVSDPVLGSSKNVFFASHNGFIWSVATEDGHALWSNRRVGGNVEAGLATDNRTLYVPSLDYKLYAFDANAGTALWDTRLDGQLNQTPMPAGQLVLTVGSGKGLFALTADHGEQKWFLPNVKQLVAHGAERAYAVDTANNLLLINLDTGAIEKTVTIPHAQNFIVNNTDATIYVLTTDGRLAAIDRAK